MKNITTILGTSLGATQNTPKYIVVHCSDVSYRSNSDQFNSINIYHRDVREFPKSTLGNWVGYHYLFTGGKQYICKEEWEVGAHCNQGFDGITVYPPATPGKLSINYQSIGLCIGFDGDIEMPPLAEYNLLQKKLWEIQDKYKIPNENVYFHRKFATNKTCPGSLITSQWLLDLLKRPEPVVVKPIENMCQEEKKTIVEQQKTIFNLRQLVQDLLAWIWKR